MKDTFIRILNKIPREINVAVSGGVDSMAVLDFLSRGKKVRAMYFNHGTEYGERCEKFLVDYCKIKDIELCIGKYGERDLSKSKEEDWRDQRYSFLESNNLGNKIITCHHLDDVIETWIFSSLHGMSKLIPYRRNEVIRPFLLNKKDVFYNWCDRKKIPYIEDPSNKDDDYMRNYIRNNIVKHALVINPGLHKNLKKKIIELNSN